MKNLIRFFLFLVILFVFASVFSVLSNKAFAQQYVEKQSVTGANLLKNPGFESGKGGWTISGTLFTNSTTNAMPPGKYSGRFTLTSYSGTLLEQSVSDCSKLSGQNLEASIYVKSATSDISVCSLSGSTEVQCQAVSPVNSFTQVILNFPAPSSGSCGIRVKTTASVTGTPEVDAAYLGLARNIGTVAQAKTLLYAERTSAQAVGSTSETTVTATAESLDVQDAFSSGVFTVKEKGNYLLSVTIQVANAISTDDFFFRWRYNSTSYTPCFILLKPTGSSETATVTCSYPANPGDTFRATVQSTTDTSYDVAIGRWSISLIPDQSELAIRPQDAAFYVDANIAGANPSLGTSAVTSYTEITNGSLTLTPASGSAPVGIMCSSTNAAATPSTSPTTCSAGSESVGFNVAIPKAGVYEVCGYFAQSIRVDTNESVSTTFQWVETATNSQTILTEGRTRLNNQLDGMNISGGADSIVMIPQSNCSLITFSSAGTKALRLMYEQSVIGTPDTSSLLADALSSLGQRDIRITMRPWLGNANAPLLVESVTSSYQGLVKLQAATTSNNNCQTFSFNPGSWISYTSKPGTGNCNFAITGFSTRPSCQVTVFADGAGDRGCKVKSGTTSTNLEVQCTANGTDTDTLMEINCFGI